MLRDELPPQRLFPHGDVGLKLDVAVPIDVVPQYLAEVIRRAQGLIAGTLPYAFGHAGDGNLHLYLMPAIAAGQTEVANFTANREALEAEVNEITWRYGGTISAEHGIGQSLREKIAGQKSDVEFDLMRKVKQALDPDGLFNPGKLLPDPDR
jgi:FAD/FMN-containing dehydrogenase